MNVPPTIGVALSADKSLIGPLSTTMGLEQLWDVLEVIQIDALNRRTIARLQAEEEG